MPSRDVSIYKVNYTRLIRGSSCNVFAWIISLDHTLKHIFRHIFRQITACHSCAVAVCFSCLSPRVDDTNVQRSTDPRLPFQGVIICKVNQINLHLNPLVLNLKADNRTEALCCQLITTVLNVAWMCQFFTVSSERQHYPCSTKTLQCQPYVMSVVSITWPISCVYSWFICMSLPCCLADADAMATAEVWEWRDSTGPASTLKPPQHHVLLLK